MVFLKMKDANVLRIRNHGNSYTLAFQMETVQLCNITAVNRDRNILSVKMYEISSLSWSRRPKLFLQAWRAKKKGNNYPDIGVATVLLPRKTPVTLRKTRIVPEI